MTTPRGLKAGGRRLWTAVISDFDLDQSASVVLAEACHTVDLLADLRAKLAETPRIIDSPQGPRVHPLLSEIRHQQLTLSRLIGALGLPKELPDDDEDSTDAS